MSPVPKGYKQTREHRKNRSKALKAALRPPEGNKKIDHYGRIWIFQPDNPMADRGGYILEHRLVMAEYIGRSLRGDEVVHHIDGDNGNNRIGNLILFSNQAEHIRHHVKDRDRDVKGRLI